MSPTIPTTVSQPSRRLNYCSKEVRDARRILRLTLGQVYLQRQQTVGRESQAYILQPQETPNEQTRSYHERQGQGYFGDYKHPEQPPPAGSDGATSGLLECLLHVRPC